MIENLSFDALRPKVTKCIEKYLSLSNNQSFTVGFYNRGKLFVLGNSDSAASLSYDIGSISKTMTAHLILHLSQNSLIDLNKNSLSLLRKEQK